MLFVKITSILVLEDSVIRVATLLLRLTKLKVDIACRRGLLLTVERRSILKSHKTNVNFLSFRSNKNSDKKGKKKFMISIIRVISVDKVVVSVVDDQSES